MSRKVNRDGPLTIHVDLSKREWTLVPPASFDLQDIAALGPTFTELGTFLDGLQADTR